MIIIIIIKTCCRIPKYVDPPDVSFIGDFVDRNLFLPSAEEFHGRGGPLGVTPVPLSPLGLQFVRAGQQLGYSIVDPLGPEQLGAFSLNVCLSPV